MNANRNVVYKKDPQGTFNGFSVEVQSEVRRNLELIKFVLCGTSFVCLVGFSSSDQALWLTMAWNKPEEI